MLGQKWNILSDFEIQNQCPNRSGLHLMDTIDIFQNQM